MNKHFEQWLAGWMVVSALTVPLIGGMQPVSAADLFAGVSSIEITDVKSKQIQIQFQADLPFEYRLKVLDNDRVALKLYSAKISSQLRGPQLNSSYTLLNLSPSRLIKQGMILNPFPGAEENGNEEIVLQGPDLGKKTLKVAGATLRPEPVIASPPPEPIKTTTKPKTAKKPVQEDSAVNLLSYDSGSESTPSVSGSSYIPPASSKSAGRFVDMGSDDDRAEAKKLAKQKRDEEEKARLLNQAKAPIAIQSRQDVSPFPTPKSVQPTAETASPNLSDKSRTQSRQGFTPKDGLATRNPIQAPKTKWREVSKAPNTTESQTETWPAPNKTVTTSRDTGIDGPTVSWNSAPGRLKVTPGNPPFFQPYAMAPDSIIQLSPTGQAPSRGNASTRSEANRVVYKPIPKYQGGAPPISFTVSTTGETITLPSAPIQGGQRAVKKSYAPQEPAINALAYVPESATRSIPKASSVSLLKQAMAMVKQGQSEDAIILLEDGIKSDPGNPALYAALGESYLKADNLHQANLAYEKASRLTPEGTYDDRYAFVLYRQGNRKKAIQVLLNLIQLNPGNAKHQFMVGTLYQELGQPQLALPYLRAAERLNPDSSDIQFNLGLAYELEGQKDMAKRHYQKAIEISPDSRDLQEALNRLKT